MAIDRTEIQEYLAQAAQRKLEAVETAADIDREIADLEQRTQAARARLDKAWRGALDVGWSEAELKRIGLTPGNRPQRSRVKKKTNDRGTETPVSD